MSFIPRQYSWDYRHENKIHILLHKHGHAFDLKTLLLKRKILSQNYKISISKVG